MAVLLICGIVETAVEECKCGKFENSNPDPCELSSQS